MKIIQRGKFRKAVFIVAYSLESGKPEYVLLKRTLHWKGWEFPKGGVEKFETKKRAVKREIKEETGLEISNIVDHKLRGKYFYPREFPDRPGFIGQTYHLFSGEVQKGKINVDKKEHSSGKFFSYREALKKLAHKEQKQSLRVVNSWLSKKLK
jgi:8-oxo-dGTP pyrophosphatase MutT (NUDIX family)